MNNVLREAPLTDARSTTDDGPCEAVVSAVIDARTARVETRDGSSDAMVATVGTGPPPA